MGRVTGGEVTYGRTVKTGDFENKRVDVKLTFGVDENEDHSVTLSAAAAQAVAKAHDMLGMPAQGSGQAAKPVTRRTASTTEKAPETKKTEPAKEVDPVLGAVGDDGIPEGLKRQAAAAEDPLGDVLDASPPAEISDKELVERITKHNAKIKAPQKIRELIAKYGVPHASSLPQDKRAAFVAELEVLTA